MAVYPTLAWATLTQCSSPRTWYLHKPRFSFAACCDGHCKFHKVHVVVFCMFFQIKLMFKHLPKNRCYDFLEVWKSIRVLLQPLLIRLAHPSTLTSSGLPPLPGGNRSNSKQADWKILNHYIKILEKLLFLI